MLYELQRQIVTHTGKVCYNELVGVGEDWDCSGRSHSQYFCELLASRVPGVASQLVDLRCPGSASGSTLLNTA